MSNVNDFLPFCATNTGTNLLSQSAYIAAPDRPIGNQPGIASSNLVNKAMRQPTYVISQLAQYISNQLAVDVLDNATPAQLLSQMMAAFQPLSPVVSRYLSGSGTHNPTYYFFIASGNATAGATYTNNSNTYTVSATISSGIVLQTTGPGVPTANGGTLTKASGTGDTTLIFYAYRSALTMHVALVGGGGGGGGSGTSAGAAAGSGGATTFGTSFLTAGGGGGGTFNTVPPTGGVNTINSGGVTLVNIAGANGGSGGANAGDSGGPGAVTYFGGNGGGGYGDIGGGGIGAAAITNSGSGGGGGGGPAGVGGDGSGGGAGGYIETVILNPSMAYAYGVGAAGSAGGAGAGGNAGGLGASGVVIVLEAFQ